MLRKITKDDSVGTSLTAMQGNCTARNAPILAYESLLSHAYENEFIFGHELNLN